MAAVAEVTIFLKELKTVDFINRIFNEKYEIDIVKIYQIDNWEHENYTELDEYNSKTIVERLKRDKIIFCELIMEKKHKCGYYVYVLPEGQYEICLWLNTKYLKEMDSSIINEYNEEQYYEITKRIVKHVPVQDLIIAGMGVEISINYYMYLNDIIGRSHGIFRWIVPKEIQVNLNKQYKLARNGNFDVYSRIGK